MLNFYRQSDIVNPEQLAKVSVTLVGAGSIGSFAGLALTKMGIEKLTVYDEDGVADHNIPGQFYRVKDGESQPFKVFALQEILKEFNGVDIETHVEFYKDQPLNEVVVVATDSMASRKMIWEQFLKQPQCRVLIEARVGGESLMLYTIKDKVADKDFYKEMLYSDEEAVDLPCSGKTIIYNVLVVAGLISRAMASVVREEAFPRELIFDMKNMIFLDRA